MNLGFHIVQQEAAERAMAAYRAKQAVREQRPATCLGRGARRLSREEAVEIIARKNPRAALKLLAGYLGGARDIRVVESELAETKRQIDAGDDDPSLNHKHLALSYERKGLQ
jgi:hypothetical protein